MPESTIPSDMPEYVVEESKPFSQSLIWQLQRQYYIDQGSNAWSKMRIPFGITTNPFIALSYSRVIYGFLRDWLAQIDVSEPVYIIEIGAGSGRLGFNILNQLETFYGTSAVKNVAYQYILTDLAEKNVEFWKTQPQLAPFVEAGKLDFARFDLVNDTELFLEHANKKMVGGAVKNPVIVIANYIWDTLPADLFYVEDGQLFEVQTALVSDQAEPDLSDPQLITRINMVYDRFAVTSDFYHDAEMQTLLEAYRQQIPDSMLLFPHIALQCIRGLQQLSNQRMMLLTADKGHHRIEELLSVDEVPIAIHDNGFSTLFNFHAIVKYFEQKGGTVLATQHQHRSINILACLLGKAEYPETRHAYHDYIERISPDDLYNVLLEFASQKEMTLQNILTFIRLKQHDTHAFVAVYRLLLSMLPEQYNQTNARNLQIMLYEVWRNYYHMDEPYNLPMAIATILQKIHDFRNALGFYTYAIQLYGSNSTIRMNMAICHMQLGNRQLALNLVTQLETELPEDNDVKHLKSQIEAMKE